MSIRSIGRIQHETLVDPPQAETAATQAAEQAQAQPSGEMVRAEAQWQHQVQRWHVLAQLERSTNGQASSSSTSHRAEATGSQASHSGGLDRATRASGSQAPDPVVLHLEVTAERAPSSAAELSYLLACELVAAVYRQAGIQLSRAAVEAVAVRLVAQGIDFTGRYDRNGQVINYPQDGLLPQPERRGDGHLVYHLFVTSRTVEQLLGYRELAEAVSRSGALSMRDSGMTERVQRALELALARGYLPEEIRNALGEQVSVEQLAVVLTVGATLGALERSGLRGLAGWIGLGIEVKQGLELWVQWDEFLSACARARSEEELDHAARLGARLLGELSAAVVVRAALRVAQLAGRVGARVATELLCRACIKMLDKMHGGHSLERHGAHLSNRELLERLTKGKVPGGGGRVESRAVPASTRFADARIHLQTYRKAIDLYKQKYGELTVPPKPNESPTRVLVIEWAKPIDEGFVGVGQQTKIGKQRVWTQTAPVDGITRTTTTFVWDAQEGRWLIVQHFPSTDGWNNTTKSYDPKVLVDFIGIPID